MIIKMKVVTYVRQTITNILANFVEEPNNETTHRAIEDQVTEILTDLMAKSVIVDYVFVLRGEGDDVLGDVAIKITEEAEFIYIPFKLSYNQKETSKMVNA